MACIKNDENFDDTEFPCFYKKLCFGVGWVA